MPKISNRNAGIKIIGSGRYQARVFHNGKEESRNFTRLDEAQRWQRNLKAELERCPGDIQRTKRKWVATLVIPTGVVTKDFPELGAAITWVGQGKAQLSLGTWIDPEVQEKVLAEYIESWKASKGSTSGKTLATYNSQLKNHILPHFGDRKLTAITTAEIRNWVSSLQSMQIGPVTIRQSYRLLHQILEAALVEEKITRNPAIGIRLPKSSRKKLPALTIEQVHALADACGKYSLLIRFLAMTGMRVNEALALRFEDLDFDTATVHVARTWTSTESGKKVLGQTKTREVRDIPLGPAILDDLKALALSNEPEAWLFTGNSADALDYGYFRRAYFEPAAKRLGLSNVTIHTLRHTCASLLIMLQAPITTVSQILGHASVKMTLDTYGHYYKDDSEKWISELSSRFQK
jgi:integrase